MSLSFWLAEDFVVFMDSRLYWKLKLKKNFLIDLNYYNDIFYAKTDYEGLSNLRLEK